MANVKVIYLCSEHPETEMQMFYNSNNKIFISIGMNSIDPYFICLDRQTAIKFSKDLRREISYMESEVDNG